jgi:glutamyl-tRNA(Gln) amidotransferase subunit E
VFLNTKSKLIQSQLQKKGCVKGIRLPGYQGLLQKTHTHLGKDFAIYAGLASGIGDIIHSDEMPGHGFSEEEILTVKQRLHLGINDAFVLALGNERMVDSALHAVLRRATMYLKGVPEEVRRSLPDNTTEYMRPLLGAARMYPETDVPPVRITSERLHRIHLPEKPKEKRQRLSHQYNLNLEQINQLLSSGYEDDFEKYVTQFPDLVSVILRTYLNTFAELENEGIKIENIDEKILKTGFSALQEGRYAKEAVLSILKYLLIHSNSSVEDAIQGCSFSPTGEEEIVQVIRRIISERKDFVKERGITAQGPLMGLVMKELRGKVDGKLINKMLNEEILRFISS